jgi:glycosyltransferase involved in cell wall biosynthesis
MGRSVAIVHDYLTQRRGAERVVLAMLRAFPDAPLYTSVYEPSTTFPEFADHDVRTLWTNRVPGLRRDHRRGLPLYPLAFSGHTVDADVTICSSSGFAHGVKTTGRKVVYCYAPARWLYDEADAYLAAWPPLVRAGTRALGGPMRTWDRWAAQSADAVLTSSTAVQDRIARHYGLHAAVLPPPVSVDTNGEQCPVAGVEPGFVLSVGRLLTYKNVDGVVAAMSRLRDHRLVVVGDGPERHRLEAMAGPNVTFVGEVGDAELRWLYASCAGLVSASFEDFGLTPIEAAAYGKPSAVLRRGGFLDTVIEGRTGVFFDDVSPAVIATGVATMLARPWRSDDLTARARAYSRDSFARSLVAVVERMRGAPESAPKDVAGAAAVGGQR